MASLLTSLFRPKEAQERPKRWLYASLYNHSSTAVPRDDRNDCPIASHGRDGRSSAEPDRNDAEEGAVYHSAEEETEDENEDVAPLLPIFSAAHLGTSSIAFH